jgi:hypothetical protein
MQRVRVLAGAVVLAVLYARHITSSGSLKTVLLGFCVMKGRIDTGGAWNRNFGTVLYRVMR